MAPLTDKVLRRLYRWCVGVVVVGVPLCFYCALGIAVVLAWVLVEAHAPTPDFWRGAIVLGVILAMVYYVVVEPPLSSIATLLYRPLRTPRTPMTADGLRSALRDLSERARKDGLLSEASALDQFA